METALDSAPRDAATAESQARPWVENRAPTGLSNPYLVCAGLLGAGLLGIADELELEPPAKAPAEEDESKEKLPTTVEESLALLEADEKLVDALLGGWRA